MASNCTNFCCTGIEQNEWATWVCISGWKSTGIHIWQCKVNGQHQCLMWHHKDVFQLKCIGVGGQNVVQDTWSLREPVASAHHVYANHQLPIYTNTLSGAFWIQEKHRRQAVGRQETPTSNWLRKDSQNKTENCYEMWNWTRHWLVEFTLHWHGKSGGLQAKPDCV